MVRVFMYFWFLVIVNVSAYSSVKAAVEGNLCNTNAGEPGQCRKWEDCDARILSMDSMDPYPAICDWYGELDFRCPISAFKSTRTSEIITTISSPDNLPYTPILSKSQQKCEEYKFKKSPKKFVLVVVGGEDVKEVDSYPFMALLGYDSENDVTWSCGGTLISEKFVLTAAHCLNNNKNALVSRVQLGFLDKRERNKFGTFQEFKVINIYNHPDRIPRVKYNDIALLELDRLVNITNMTYPACLHTDFNIPYSSATALGWGTTGFGEDASNFLQEVNLTISTQEECIERYKDEESTLPRGLNYTTQLCAGDKDKDTCQGDSGGPLLVTDITNTPYIIGITSAGAFCGGENPISIYSRVSHYVPWIESIVWP